jgi:fumarate reductase flavoprotein subunit
VVDELLVEDGRVCGVEYSQNGHQIAQRAGSVILASGGFSQSEELLTEWAPQMVHAVREGGAGNTGDGLRLATKLGAGLADMESIKGTFGRFPWRSAAEDGAGILVVYKGAIAVNGEGRRFIDESLPYKVIGDACLEQSGHMAFQIFDRTILDAADEAVPIYSFRRRLDAGQVTQADTVKELAEKLGIDSETLSATVDSYNERLRTDQTDEFQRATLVGGVGSPVPIETAPFYGYPSTTTVLSTYCGITIDPFGRVTDAQGTAIPGLYAAGEVTGGFHGDGYVTGSSLGKSAIFGKLAGEVAAREATR